MLIENNVTDYWIMTGNMTNVAIRNNTISSVSGPAEWAGIELASGSPSSNVVISGNTILGGETNGFSQTGGPGTISTFTGPTTRSKE